ncbi:MAG: hypothetical protein GKR94_25910 [Gammaproteobacteria bacterium]|nr:hypothetical protein [Gammaproteobacteria bacterium]
MGNLRTNHLVEAGFWLLLALFLYAYSIPFDKEIEIYKYGAAAWPRAIIVFMVLASLGQLIWQWRRGDGEAAGMLGAASGDGAEEAAREAGHSSLAWYLSTAGVLAMPFVYMLLPDWISSGLGLEKTGGHAVRVIIAGLLSALFIWAMPRNSVGAMLSLPIFFAALLQDLGFYAIAPVFILGVMFLMGERRAKWMLSVMVLLYGIILALFLKLLYVGLPTGNIRPFYDFGTWVVTVLQ